MAGVVAVPDIDIADYADRSSIFEDLKQTTRRAFVPYLFYRLYQDGAWYAARLNLGRPIDMGGPRDIWIEQSSWDEL